MAPDRFDFLLFYFIIIIIWISLYKSQKKGKNENEPFFKDPLKIDWRLYHSNVTDKDDAVLANRTYYPFRRRQYSRLYLVLKSPQFER